MSIFDKWNKNIDKDFKKSVEDLDAGKGGTYEKVPYGTYEVKIAKMELRESKNGDPMLAVQFRILEGKYKNNLIYKNQVVQIPYQIHLANDFLKSLDSSIEVKFSDYAQYNDMIMDIAEAIDTAKLEYALVFGQDEKGYDTFTIGEVFESEEA